MGVDNTFFDYIIYNLNRLMKSNHNLQNSNIIHVEAHQLKYKMFILRDDDVGNNWNF